MRPVAAAHGLTNEAPIESGMQEKGNNSGKRRRRPGEDATSVERTLVACWFRHLARNKFESGLAQRNTPINAKRTGTETNSRDQDVAGSSRRIASPSRRHSQKAGRASSSRCQ